VQNFDETFLDMKPVINDPAEEQDGDDATTDTDGQPTDTDGEAGTPLQSRSPSLVPAGDDVFDGYSFKGRHSVLLDDEDDSGGSGGSSGEDTEEEGAGAPPATAKPDVEAAAPVPEEVAEEEEPKTPEARPAALPDVLVEEKAPETAAVEPSAVHEPAPELKAELQSEAPVEETKPAEATKPAEEAKPALAVETTASKAPEDVPLPPDEAPFEVPPTVEAPVTPVSTRPTLPAAVVSEPAPVTAAKELAPVPAAKEAAPVPVAKELGPATGAKELVDESRESLDVVPPMAAKGTVRISARTGKPKREKSGVPALDRFLSEDENGNGTELEEDDWDIVEAVATEERNGARGNSLFARGVVDRYRLSVFRKGSTPQRAPHSLSGSANASFVSDAGAESPSPSAKQRRGRNPGLTFRRHPKEFLRGKSPPSVASSSASARVSAQTLHQSVSQALSTASGSTPGVLTPSPSLGASAAGSPSLRTKESTLSVATTPSMSSDVSADSSPGHDATVRSPEEAPKNKKVLKKYKEGAEKVLALFSSPR
jgi:serum/glucocorticoid-regulated kinase 2